MRFIELIYSSAAAILPLLTNDSLTSPVFKSIFFTNFSISSGVLGVSPVLNAIAGNNSVIVALIVVCSPPDRYLIDSGILITYFLKYLFITSI